MERPISNFFRERRGHSSERAAVTNPTRLRCPPLLSLLLLRCLLARSRRPTASGIPTTPNLPPRSRCKAAAATPEKVVAGAASCSLLKSNRTACFSWMVGHLVVLLNTKAAPMARLQRLAEISDDSFQLSSACLGRLHSLLTATNRARAPSRHASADRSLRAPNILFFRGSGFADSGCKT